MAIPKMWLMAQLSANAEIKRSESRKAVESETLVMALAKMASAAKIMSALICQLISASMWLI